jgi:hypothetical protein
LRWLVTSCAWLGPVRLTFRDLADVIHGERYPAAILMEGNLPPVRASPQRALRHIFEPEAAEDLRRLRRREDGSQAEHAHIRDSHAIIITVMQITS